MIDTTQMREAVQDKNYRNVWLDGSTHYEGCEYEHYPCAVLKLCDEVDRLSKPISTKVQLPPQYIQVLVYDTLDEEWSTAHLVGLDTNGTLFQWGFGKGIYIHGDDFARITHWMPLPPEPEDEP